MPLTRREQLLRHITLTFPAPQWEMGQGYHIWKHPGLRGTTGAGNPAQHRSILCDDITTRSITGREPASECSQDPPLFPEVRGSQENWAQHNKVERRRWDKINNWIVQLSKIIPDCSMESIKSDQSKGGILSKACDYIQELRQSKHRLSEELQGLDQLQLDNDVLQQQVEDIKNKNLLLRAQLQHHGLEVVIKNDSN